MGLDQSVRRPNGSIVEAHVATLADIIRSTRKRLGLSQTELSKKTGISDRTIREIELGKAAKSGRRRETLECLAIALELPRDLLCIVAGVDVPPVVDGAWLGPLPTLASLQERLAALQGISVDTTTACAIGAHQRAALQGLMFKAGEPALKTIWTSPMHTLSEGSVCAAQRPLGDFLVRLMSYVRDLRGEFISRPEVPIEQAVLLMFEKLRREWANIPYSLGLDDALFAEYILGLVYFEAFAHLTRTLEHRRPIGEDRLLAGALDVSSYAAGLDGVFRLHDYLLSHLNAWFDDTSREEIWRVILEAREKSEVICPGFAATLDNTVSLRVDAIRLPVTTTAAQMLHWDGWGGDGRVLEDINAPRKQSPGGLIDTLHRNRFHAFDWHQLRGGELHPIAHFASRQAHFREAAGALARNAAGCTAALLSHPRLDSTSDVQFWADGVGPTAIAERRIQTRLRAIAAQREQAAIRMQSILTDVSASALMTLATTEIGSDPATTLLWRDLTKDFPGEPNCPIPDFLCEYLKPGFYDCYSCSMTLHHIADARAGRERIQQLFAFATRIVRPGGIISLPDVGPGVALQVYILPINLVDREGRWGCATYFNERGFLGVACTENGDFLQADYLNNPDIAYKIPVPILPLRRGTPMILDAHSLAIYEYVPYIVVAVDLGRLLRFDQAWRNARSYDERQYLVLDLLTETWSEMENILNDVNRTNPMPDLRTR